MYATGTIGVLDMQGGVQEHLEHLQRLGIAGRPVKHAAQLGDLAGLIIPGGESTCLSRLLRIFGLDVAIRARYQQGLKLWGTCAGAILLARDCVGEAPLLALMDITIARNAFGSQLDSFNCTANVPTVSNTPIPLTFIRAPKIVQVGQSVRVLLQMDDYIAAAEDAQCLATVFHPELTASLAFHQYFVEKCGLSLEKSRAHGENLPWTVHSWTHFAPRP